MSDTLTIRDTTIDFGTGTSATVGAFDSVSGGTLYATGFGNSFNVTKKKGMPPQFVFALTKKKMGVLQSQVLKRRVKALWKLAEESEEINQNALAEKCLKELECQLRESEMYAASFRLFIEKELLEKFIEKSNASRDILITKLEEFTRVIPDDVRKKIDRAQKYELFDSYIVVHYDPKLEGVSEEKKQEIQEARKDPIVFGVIKQSTKLYYIADWEDKYCDLTFDQVLDKLELHEEDITLSKEPEIILN